MSQWLATYNLDSDNVNHVTMVSYIFSGFGQCKPCHNG